MSSILKYSAFLMLFVLFVSTACSKNDPATPGGCAANFNYAVELEAEFNAFANAATAYAQDQTTENCNAYKVAAQAYLDAAADVEVCVPVADKAAYQMAIDEAKAEIDALSC